MKIFIIFIICLMVTSVQAAEHDHGFVSKSSTGQPQAWHANKSEWLSIDSFWQDFAKNNNTKSWPISETYPNYADVSELDTFTVKLEEGTCLMQFYHSRWRRANDVQRWDDAFNDYSACPYVFN